MVDLSTARCAAGIQTSSLRTRSRMSIRKRPTRSFSLSSCFRCYAANPSGRDSQPPSPPSSIPVAIVGAGPAGLTLSALLSQFGVPSVLLEKASALPTHPQAHFINLRSMEIMRHAFQGLDRRVLDKCPPRDEWRLVHSIEGDGKW